MIVGRVNYWCITGSLSKNFAIAHEKNCQTRNDPYRPCHFSYCWLLPPSPRVSLPIFMFAKRTPATHRSHLPSSTLIDQEDEKQSSDGLTLSDPIVQVFGRLSDCVFQRRHLR